MDKLRFTAEEEARRSLVGERRKALGISPHKKPELQKMRAVHHHDEWVRLENPSELEKVKRMRSVRSRKRTLEETIGFLENMSSEGQAMVYDHDALGTDCGCSRNPYATDTTPVFGKYSC
ncbi:MAG: hypothetical protein P8J01_00725 [Acidimicrobiales bacterium]|nr:hypothetical protein [Acidimicrobiales bacterium]MDG1844896.1 hypothetical protein [Acidimicrobiales bacterium]|tara:strand:+ start:440 stop:799 length:360 start_codon:yes stop_codon:yes gene_type:complete